MPTASDFQTELNNIFLSAQNKGLFYIDVKSDDLHKQVGGYSKHNHRMPVCCEVMKRNIKKGDQILQQPQKGQGASLIIRYTLPK